MARIDYSNVSISLHQFEEVASGKYNAGEVKLTGQHTLERINNHIHFTRFNSTPIPHAEVLAIKNAFVRALSEGGVNAEEIMKLLRSLHKTVVMVTHDESLTAYADEVCVLRAGVLA